MLQAFNDRIRNSRWLGYVIVGLISIPFALWGIQSYLGGASGNVAAEVNGEPIPVYQVQRMASQQRQDLRQRFGGRLPEGLDDRLFLERALSEAINREVLRQASVDKGFRVTDETLRRNIRDQEMFQRDGEFDRDLYRRILSQSGLSASDYEADVRAGYAIQQLQRGVADSGFVLAGEARTAARLMNEERRLAVLVYPASAAAAQVAVDEDEVREFYENNTNRFQRPAQVRVAYLELDMDELATQVNVTEEELRAEYRGNQSRYRGRQERRAAHILLEVDAATGDGTEEAVLEKARELRSRLEEGASFAELARAHSDDPGSAEQGGDLGYVSRDTMVEAFEKALFALEGDGSISEPVRSPYGYHLIKLLDVRKTGSRSFEDVREEIEADLRARRAERLFYDRVEVLRNSSYEQPGSLEPAADSTGLEIQTSDWFSRQSGEGIASNAAIRQTAFSPDVRVEGLNSDLVELGQRHVVVLRVQNERPAQPRPFEVVREQARELLLVDRVEEIQRRWIEETRARLDEGADPAALAEEPVTLEQSGWVRRSEQRSELDPAIRERAFALPAPGSRPVHGEVALPTGDRAVVIVEAARLPEVDERLVAESRQGLSQGRIRGEIRAYIAALREAADITRNQEALNRQ